MLTRLLLTLRLKLRPVRLLQSWQLSVVLMVVAALYWGLLTIWATSAPPHVVGNIAGLLPFWLLYLLLLLNTGFCLWARLPLLRRELTASERYRERPPILTRDLPAEHSAEALQAALREQGFKLRPHDDGLLATRGRWAALGTYLFHTGLLLLAPAFLLTMAGRHEATLRLAAGETFHGDQLPDQVQTPGAVALGLAGSVDLFTVESITPELWQDQLLFTRLEAVLRFADGSEAVTRINRPIWLGPATTLRLTGFGYAPSFELLDRNGNVIDAAVVKLDVFPPGQRDYFTLQEMPHRISVEVIGDAIEREGKLVARSLDLVNPAIRTRVDRGRLTLAEAVVSLGEAVSFEGLQLRFPEIRYWAQLQLVRDPGMPVLLGAFALALIGLLLRLGGPRTELLWAVTEESSGKLLVWGAVDTLVLPEPDGEEGE